MSDAGKGPSGGPSGGGPSRYAGLGLQLAITILVFVWVGQWLDRKLGTGGLATIVCVFLGFGGVMYGLVRQLNRRDGDSE